MAGLRRSIPVFLCVLVWGCARAPEYWPLPAQRTVLKPLSFRAIDHFASMDQPNAASYIVRDISPELSGGAWHWTGKRPTLRFRLLPRERLSFLMDLVLYDEGFRRTGPVSISFAVNGKPLDAVRYDNPGEKHILKPVPAEWLHTGEDNHVTAEIDKTWTPKGSHTVYGFILIRAGFVQSP